MLSIDNIFDFKYSNTFNMGSCDGNMNFFKTFHIILCYLC